jgi:hypothetical protein
VLTAFGLGFTPPIQRQAGTDLHVRAHAVDVLLPLAIAPVAPLDGMRGGGQQRVVKKRQGLFQGRGKELGAGCAQRREPQEPPPQFGQCGEGSLGAATPIKQGVDLLHAGAPRAHLRQITGATPQRLPFPFAQGMLDKQRPMGEQVGALGGQPLFLAGCRLCGLRAWPSFGPLGLRGCQALAGAGDRTQHGFDHLGDAVKRAEVLRHSPAHLHEGLGRERRTIGGDSEEDHVTGRQGRFETPEKRADVHGGGIVLQHVREAALVAAIIDRGQQAARAILPFIGSDRARKSATAQSRKSGSRRACAFFSPCLDPVLDRGAGHKDTGVAPQMPARRAGGQAVFDYEPYRQIDPTVGRGTARWRESSEVGVEVLATLGAGVLCIGDHEITRRPDVEIPEVVSRPLGLRVTIGQMVTPRTRLSRVGAAVRNALWQWQVCKRWKTFRGIGALCTWTGHCWSSLREGVDQN